MTRAAITLEVLPAGFGDCLLVSCPVGRRSWRMLVDTGPDENYPALRRRLLAIPPDRTGARRIDLFVVTHIDHDHIGGAKLLLDDAALGLKFGDIWFNAPPRRRVRGVAEGQSLANILGATETKLPWNVAWQGDAVAAPAGSGGVTVSGRGTPRLTVLSPPPERLLALFGVWARELERLRRKEHDELEPEAVSTRPVTRGAAVSLEALAAARTSEDRAVPNGSSIAILLEHKGASALLCGDAFPDVLVQALAALARQRGEAVPAFDLVKLSHHGSRANVTQALMRAFSARHFVVSTDNRYFKHPNAEALARVITGAERPVLWFNYDTPQNRRWADRGLQERYGYEARFPTGPDDGVTVELPARRGTATPAEAQRRAADVDAGGRPAARQPRHRQEPPNLR
jgi:beta-lactamase superfamily II metal-dependent hydrolase